MHLVSTLFWIASAILVIPTMAEILHCDIWFPEYEKLVANHSSQFHMNLDKGDVGRRANAALATASMFWTTNNATTIGQKQFVNGLLSFDSSFTSFQIHDMLHLNNGNMVSILYVFQGTQGGTFDGIPATGRKIEAWNGELMVFNDEALLSRLITVNNLNQFQLEITGAVTIDEFQNVTLASNPQTPSAYRTKIKNVAAQFNKNFNNGKTAANSALVTSNIIINTNSAILYGQNALKSHFNKYNTSLPDLLAYDEYILADGHYAAVEFV